MTGIKIVLENSVVKFHEYNHRANTKGVHSLTGNISGAENSKGKGISYTLLEVMADCKVLSEKQTYNAISCGLLIA